MFCYMCRKEVEIGSKFCEFCGADLRKGNEEISVEPTEECAVSGDNEQLENISFQPQESQSEGITKNDNDDEKLNIIDDKSKELADVPKEKTKKNKKNISIIAVLSCVIIASLIVTGITVYRANSWKMSEISANNISVIDCEFDWNSAYYDKTDEAYRVDFLMIVRNDSDDNISGFTFSACDKNETVLENILNNENTFIANGYVPSNDEGLVIGTMWLKKEHTTIETKSLRVVTAFKFKGVAGYNVPIGKLTDAKGINKDFYTMTINNTNDVDIKSTTSYVAVIIKNNKIMDFDATGRVESNVAAGASHMEFDNVFRDPNFNNNYKEYTVYAIDCQSYK